MSEQAPLIQIVDDDLTARLLMRASLEKAGFQVAEAADGLEAVGAFAELQPDAILLDVIMPKMNGFDTCRAIRNHSGGGHTPILMLTGLEDIDSIHQAFDSGATDFISKPINWTVLTYRVKYMLRASDAFHDVITQREQIQKLAYFDHLTGLSNRTMFRDGLETTLAECAENEDQLAILFMDLDRFKNVNDTLGHHVGDFLLQQVAERINVCIRGSDSFARVKDYGLKTCVSRLGGDEFTIMLPKITDPQDAGKVARRIVDTFNKPFHLEKNEVYITASIGISLFPLDGHDVDELIKQADLAMYHAKELGKNNYQYYEKNLNIKAQERFIFEADLRKAIKEEELKLWYQPQIDMQTGRIVGAEALTRWQHYERGMVPPDTFIPMIEELGLIIPFTDWVIRQAGTQQLNWSAQKLKPIRVSINISSKHFTQQDLPEKILYEISNELLEKGIFEIELTESVLAEQGNDTLEILSELKKMGLTISVDDFGTGYSSLLYLKNFPIDTIKIDRFFVKDIHANEQDALIVKAIIAMAKSLKMTVIGEGIETHAQYAMLKEMGCDVGQGYLFGPAVPADDLGQMLQEDMSLAPSG